MILESAYSRLTEIGLVKRGVGSEAFSSLPARTRFADGTSRIGSVRLRRLAYLWDHIPSCREESQASYGAYEGGDMIDVGAYHGWYSVLLAPKSKPGISSFHSTPISASTASF